MKELGRQVYLGGYEHQEHAAEAYDVAALKCKGFRVKTNFDAARCVAHILMLAAPSVKSRSLWRLCVAFHGIMQKTCQTSVRQQAHIIVSTRSFSTLLPAGLAAR